MNMKAVIVLTLLVQLSQVVEYVHCGPQFALTNIPLLQLPQCFSFSLPMMPPSPMPQPPGNEPASPPPPGNEPASPSPPGNEPASPSPPGNEPASPPPPSNEPSSPPPPDGSAPPPSAPSGPVPPFPSAPPTPSCSPLTTAVLLDIIGNLLNLPKGSLSNVPPQQPDAEAAPQPIDLPQNGNPGPSPGPDTNEMTPDKLQTLIAQLSTPQALDPQIKIPFLQSVLSSSLTPDLPRPSFPQPPQSITQQLENNVRPMFDECIKNMPIYQNPIRSEEEQVVNNVPIMENTVTNQDENFIRNVPIMRKIVRPVMETRTRHIPMIKKRIRTVIEPYTCHVPILEKYIRPVEEVIVSNIPVMENQCIPMLTARQVPIDETPIQQNPSGNCPFPLNSPPINPFLPHLDLPNQRLSILRPPCRCPCFCRK